MKGLVATLNTEQLQSLQNLSGTSIEYIGEFIVHFNRVCKTEIVIEKDSEVTINA